MESILDFHGFVVDAETFLTAGQEGMVGAPPETLARFASLAKECAQLAAKVDLAPLLQMVRRLELARIQNGFYEARREVFFRCRTSDPSDLAIVIADYDEARWIKLRTNPKAKIVETVYLAGGKEVPCTQVPELRMFGDVTDAIGKLNDQCDGGRNNPLVWLGKGPRRPGQRRVPGEVEPDPLQNRKMRSNTRYRMVDLHFESLRKVEDQVQERFGPPRRDDSGTTEPEGRRSNRKARNLSDRRA